MNTEILTTPSPELKKHVKDLRRDAGNVTQDLKNQASAGLDEIQSEANSRLQDAKERVFGLTDTFRNFVVEHPFQALGAGVLAGFVLASWRRR